MEFNRGPNALRAVSRRGLPPLEARLGAEIVDIIGAFVDNNWDEVAPAFMVDFGRRTGRPVYLRIFDDRDHVPVELRGKPCFRILQYEEPLVDGSIYYDNRFWRSPRGHQEVPLRTYGDVVAVVEGETAKCAAIRSSRLHTRAEANEARISRYNELVHGLDALHAEARFRRYRSALPNLLIEIKERELNQLGTLIPTRFPLRL
jgi:hypothetical protein